MRVTLITKTADPIVIEDVEGVMGASEAFPYWVIRYEEDAYGNTRARFFAISEVLQVDIVGKTQEERNLASVTPLNPDMNEEYFGDRPIS